MYVLLGIMGAICVALALLILATAVKSDIQLILAAILFVGGWGVIGLSSVVARIGLQRGPVGKVTVDRNDRRA